MKGRFIGALALICLLIVGIVMISDTSEPSPSDPPERTAGQRAARAERPALPTRTEAGSFRVSGVVLTEADAPVEGVEVAWRPMGDASAATAKTDAEGRFFLDLSAPGTLSVAGAPLSTDPAGRFVVEVPAAEEISVAVRPELGLELRQTHRSPAADAGPWALTLQLPPSRQVRAVCPEEGSCPHMSFVGCLRAGAPSDRVLGEGSCRRSDDKQGWPCACPVEAAVLRSERYEELSLEPGVTEVAFVARQIGEVRSATGAHFAQLPAGTYELSGGPGVRPAGAQATSWRCEAVEVTVSGGRTWRWS